MKSRDLMAQCENLSYRKLNYWCVQGLFGDDLDTPSRYRDFTETDLRAAQVIARVSNMFGKWSGGRGAFVGLYREIANQARTGADPIHVSLGDGIDFYVTAGDSHGSVTEFDPILDPPMSGSFVPGVGVDNA